MFEFEFQATCRRTDIGKTLPPMGTGMECPKCRHPIRSFGQHLRQHPGCRARSIDAPEVVFDSGPQFSDSMDVEYDIQAAERRRRLADVLSECRYEKCWSNADVAHLKRSFGDMYSAASLKAYDALQPLLRSGVTGDDVHSTLDRVGSSAFQGIETRELELASSRNDVPYLEPRVVSLAPGSALIDQVVSFSLKDLLIRDLQNDPVVRQHTLKKSDEYKLGKNWCAIRAARRAARAPHAAARTARAACAACAACAGARRQMS